MIWGFTLGLLVGMWVGAIALALGFALEAGRDR